MMPERELLQRAARAAGIVGHYYEASDLYTAGIGYNDELDCFRMWCPLTDDGDALRLLTRLSFRELYVSEIGATVSWRREDASGHGWKCDEYAEEHGGDLNAATRLAIVRAAAAMAPGDAG